MPFDHLYGLNGRLVDTNEKYFGVTYLPLLWHGEN